MGTLPTFQYSRCLTNRLHTFLENKLRVTIRGTEEEVLTIREIVDSVASGSIWTISGADVITVVTPRTEGNHHTITQFRENHQRVWYCYFSSCDARIGLYVYVFYLA